jgi:hypothetical protein
MRSAFLALALAVLAGCVSTTGPTKLPHGCAPGTPYLACTKAHDDGQRALRDLRRLRIASEENAHELREIRKGLDADRQERKAGWRFR